MRKTKFGGDNCEFGSGYFQFEGPVGCLEDNQSEAGGKVAKSREGIN